MNTDMAVTRWLPNWDGCLVDSHHGQYAIPMMIDIAIDHGFIMSGPFSDIAPHVLNDLANYGDLEAGDALIWFADEAELFMNAYLAPLGYAFGWHDGDYILATLTDWSEL